jgi:hypothetical protein
LKKKTRKFNQKKSCPDIATDGGFNLDWKNVYETIKDNKFFKSEYFGESGAYMSDFDKLITSDDPEYVKFLIYIGLMPKRGYYRIIILAIQNNYLKVLKFLLELPEIINDPDLNFNDLLKKAVKHNSHDIIKFMLVLLGIVEDVDFNELLNESFKYKNLDIVELLLTYPLDQLSVDNIVASMQGEHIEGVKFLLNFENI